MMDRLPFVNDVEERERARSRAPSYEYRPLETRNTKVERMLRSSREFGLMNDIESILDTQLDT